MPPSFLYRMAPPSAAGEEGLAASSSSLGEGGGPREKRRQQFVKNDEEWMFSTNTKKKEKGNVRFGVLRPGFKKKNRHGFCWSCPPTATNDRLDTMLHNNNHQYKEPGQKQQGQPRLTHQQHPRPPPQRQRQRSRKPSLASRGPA